MTDSGASRVVLSYALSEEGRRDAFHRGEQIPRQLDWNCDNWETVAIFRRVVDRDVDPELFERASALCLLLDESGTVANAPIGSSYDDLNNLWRTTDREAQWVNRLPLHVKEFGDREYCGLLWRLTDVAKRQMWPYVIEDVLDEIDGSARSVEFAFDGFNEDWILKHFTPFDEYLSTEELIAFEESARAAAEVVAASFDDDEEQMRNEYATWLRRARDHQLELYEEWISSIDGDIDTSEFDDYRTRLAALDPPIPHDTVVTLLRDRPPELVKLRKALEAAARSAKELADAAEWACEFGSVRLQRIESEGLMSTSMSVYRDERLAKERPGWGWQDPDVTLRDPAAPTEEAFDLLDAARDLEPDCSLRFATLGKGSGRFVASAEFLGRPIWFPGDALADIEGAGR